MYGKSEHQLMLLGLQGSVASILRNFGECSKQESPLRSVDEHDIMFSVKDCRWREDQLLQLLLHDRRTSVPSLFDMCGLELLVSQSVPEPNRTDMNEGLGRPAECIRGSFLPVTDTSNYAKYRKAKKSVCANNQAMAALLLSSSPPAFSVSADVCRFDERCVQECLPGTCTVSTEAFYMFKSLAQELLECVIEQSERSRQLHKNQSLSREHVYEAFEMINRDLHQNVQGYTSVMK